MNYIMQLNAFWRWRELHDITHAEADLYFALLGIFNDFFWRENLSIPSKSPIMRAELCDKSQLHRLRKGLVDKGLITYTEGKYGRAGTYNIVKLYSDVDIENTTESQSICNGFDNEFNNNSDTINKTETKTETETNIYTSAQKSERAEEIQAVADSYNEICKSLKPVTKLTAKRKTAIRARLKSYTAEQLREAFIRAEASDFLCGRKGEWTASFDWLVKNDDNILKVLEGNFDNASNNNSYNNFNNSFNNTFNTPTEDVTDIEQKFMNVYGA